jgi:mono/diheme cytochrome c family protein
MTLHHFTHRRARVADALVVALVAVAIGITACGGKPASQDAAPAAAAAAPAGAPDGANIYLRCAACHQPTGAGLPGTYPPLAGSEIANGPPATPIRIVLRGLQGPVTVHGTAFNGVMPAYGTGVEMSDAEVAAVLTHVRSQWGNAGGPVTAEQVATERTAIANRPGPWTAAELGLKP